MVLQGHAVAYRRYSLDYVTAEEKGRAEVRRVVDLIALRVGTI
jgi:hypothetical protein